MKANKPIEDQDLDALLKVHYLNEFSEENSLTVAQSVFAKDYDVAIDPEKEKQLLNKLEQHHKGGINWKNTFGILAFVGLIIWGVVSEWPFTAADPEKQEVLTESRHSPAEADREPKSTSTNPNSSKQTDVIQQEFVEADSSDIAIALEPDLDLTELLEEPQEQDETPDKPPTQKQPPLPDQREPQQALFTQAELTYYQQLKRSVIENLVAYDATLYTEIDGGIVNYKKKKRNVDGFIMRNISVTNMEYKTFLADLITKRNPKGLEVGLVNQEGWTNHQCKQLGEDYFNDHRYDGFPVVNISPEAMVLFCKWLEQEVNAYLKLSDPKSKPVKIRLPYTYEWIHAAYLGFAHMKECPGYYTIFSLNEGYVNKGFLNRVEKIRKKGRKRTTEADTLLDIDRYGMPEQDMLQLFESVMPNSSADWKFQEYPAGLVNIGKAAHVSELNQDESGERTVIVGCWKSKEEYSGMLSDFKALPGSPFVGFRFVIDDGKPRNFIDPLWR